jgi:putative peptidoglycan lipid II flippase
VPVILSSVSVVVNLTLSLLLVGPFGFEGLAAATSLAALVNAALCLLLLRVQLGGLAGARLAVAFVKIAVASLVMSATVVAVSRAVYQIASTGSVVTQGAALLCVIGSAIVALALAARALRIEEFASITGEVIRRVRLLLER